MSLKSIASLDVRRRMVESLARHVAEMSLEPICRLVADRVATMSLCEARGYIRARSAREIRRQARLALATQPAADAAWELPVVLRATERVAPLALRRLMGARTPQPLPVQAPALRARRGRAA
jgi:hypothetical protein